MKKIYIAHPLMGSTDRAKTEGWGDRDANIERYLRFCAKASNAGYVVISWVHHYLMHVRGLTPDDDAYYLSRDEALLKDADEIWVCGPNWASSGLVFEVACAEKHNIPSVTNDRWMDPSYMPEVD